MAPGYGISSIDSAMSPLGNYGLGYSGTFGSYDNYMPSMMGMGLGAEMGMNNSIFGSPMMGMGMYNPAFMAQMQQAQSMIEKFQAQHASDMHEIIANNGVKAFRETDSALVQRMLTNGDVKQGVQNLFKKVKEGDQDGICNEFDKLKNYIYSNYRDELAARGDKTNPQVATTEIIEALYSNLITAQTGVTSDLRSDVDRYGESAFMNGFNQKYKAGHHQRYLDETKNHLFGYDIDDRGSHEHKRALGAYIGRAAHGVKTGATTGVLAAGTGLTAAALIRCLGVKNPKFNLKNFKKLGRVGMIAGAAAAIVDIIKPDFLNNIFGKVIA